MVYHPGIAALRDSGHDRLMKIRSLAHRVDRRWRAAAAALLLAAIGGSCAARGVDRLMQNWHGHRLPELLATWGAPRYAYADGAGGHVLLYVPDAESTSATGQQMLRSGARLADQLVH